MTVHHTRIESARMMTGQLEKRILLVEDDAALRTMMLHLLRNAGFHPIVACSDVDAAILHGQTIDFDIALVDVNLAGGNGMDVVRALKSPQRHTQPAVIVVTGDGHPSLIRRAWRAGAEDVLIKPFDPASLDVRIRVLLALRGHDHVWIGDERSLGSQTYLAQ